MLDAAELRDVVEIRGLATELRELRDVVEIRGLADRYSWAYDTHDGEGFVACWTEDGHAERRGSELQYRGHKQLAALVEGWPMKGRHLTSHMDIQLDGDTATMRCYCLYVDLGPPCEISMFGQYYDKLVRVDRKWKFKQRSFEVISIRDSEVSPEFMKTAAALGR